MLENLNGHLDCAQKGWKEVVCDSLIRAVTCPEGSNYLPCESRVPSVLALPSTTPSLLLGQGKPGQRWKRWLSSVSFKATRGASVVTPEHILQFCGL